jgi:hypothetical protein
MEALQKHETSHLSLGTVDDYIRFAEMLVEGGFATTKVPQDPHLRQQVIYQTAGKLLMGREMGLSTMASLGNITLINGKWAVWGDAAIGLAWRSGLLIRHNEFIDDSDPKDPIGICIVERRNDTAGACEYRFSWQDALRAELTTRGPWRQYPKRMLIMRARGFALRDKFADLLVGLITAEEAQDYPAETEADSPSSRVDMVLGTLKATSTPQAIEKLLSEPEYEPNPEPEPEDVKPSAKRTRKAWQPKQAAATAESARSEAEPETEPAGEEEPAISDRLLADPDFADFKTVVVNKLRMAGKSLAGVAGYLNKSVAELTVADGEWALSALKGKAVTK